MKMGEKIKEKTRHITEVMEKALFPNVCPICNKVISSDEKICSHCIKKIKVIKEPKCKKCGSRLEDSTKLFCNDCNEICHEFEKGISIFEYNNEFKKIYGINIEDENIDKILWSIFDKAITNIIFVISQGKGLTLEEIYEGYNIGKPEMAKLKKLSKRKNTRR